MQVRIDQIGNRIEVEAVYPRQWFSFGLKPQVLVHFEVTMQGRVSSHRLVGKMFHGGELLRIRASDGDI